MPSVVFWNAQRISGLNSVEDGEASTNRLAVEAAESNKGIYPDFIILGEVGDLPHEDIEKMTPEGYTACDLSSREQHYYQYYSCDRGSLRFAAYCHNSVFYKLTKAYLVPDPNDSIRPALFFQWDDNGTSRSCTFVHLPSISASAKVQLNVLANLVETIYTLFDISDGPEAIIGDLNINLNEDSAQIRGGISKKGEIRGWDHPLERFFRPKDEDLTKLKSLFLKYNVSSTGGATHSKGGNLDWALHAASQACEVKRMNPYAKLPAPEARSKKRDKDEDFKPGSEPAEKTSDHFPIHVVWKNAPPNENSGTSDKIEIEG
jgi:hypothetical protein